MDINKKIKFKFNTDYKTGYIYFKSQIKSNELTHQIELKNEENNIHIVFDLNQANELSGIELISIPELPKELFE